ncbi:hypothetical protein [Arabidopsis thaliana]|uniref:RPB1a n=1 Tax=Arabidopsis thaliana TaxID=3702 RepID=Q9C7K2_ARATH|nr:RPB1a [Arabidopsis thaliana]AAG50901.1 hypothetical protein [Arabidopsis thaliana]AAT69201.1 hypothetical protein At1g56270 [Arabidopsis thaliana]AEE33371.1 RPB1a [Arabidopsis thaliana]|eukprot:NP_176023.1 RPB1a [Arabidopsis thaliana]
MSANHTTLHSSGDEEPNHELYSAAVHKLVVLMNAGVFGFLQLSDLSAIGTNAVVSTSVMFETHRATFLCYWVLILIYAFLRIYEIKLRIVSFRMLVGHISHLFGALAALLLISVVSSIFSLIVVPLWLAWLFAVLYIAFRDVINLPANSLGGVDPPNQLVSV